MEYMNTNKFTLKSQEGIANAQQIAQSYGNQQVEPIHILAALIQDSESVIISILQKLGANLNYIKIKTNEIIEKLPKVTSSVLGQQYLSKETGRLLENAFKEAENLKDEYISTEHLLIALLTDKSDQAAKLLIDQGITKDNVLKVLKDIRGSQRVVDQNPEDKYQALDKFGRDLNDLARRGKLDPVIGREEEIRRVLQVLSRRTKNNPVLIGEPGVGKTAIAEGMAFRIVQGDVPENLKTKKIIALDMGSLIAGTQFRGQFEDRMKSVIKEIIESNGEIILFIDELHTLVGAGAAQGAVDAANILKPALARGELHCIGATTLDEYRKHIEKDSALERRFQPVLIEEPNEEDTISILRGLKERYEIHHGVRITDAAIVAASQLSNRYISDRFLPDKAIDLVDEAASKLRIEIDSMPDEVDEIERRIRQLEIEREAIKRDMKSISIEKTEFTELSQKKISDIDNEIYNLKEKYNSLKFHWKNEKDLIQSIRKMKEDLDHLKTDADNAEREGDLGKVAEIRYGKVIEIQSKMKSASEKLQEIQKDKKMLKEEVDAEDIAQIVAKWTGIPVNRMLEGERVKLINMEERLHHRVIGQDEAVKAISDAIRRSRAGLQDQKKPIGSFIFMGTTGIGKTELARALAEFLFDDENAIVRIDMSEYMEKFSVSRLIGAPPGYVGFEEGGQLTEAVRRRPYSVVLLDEIEKAHPEVFDVLLQLLDDGRLTDNKGRTVNFKNTIIIMTSNIGSQMIQEYLSKSNYDENLINDIYGEMKSRLILMLREKIRPEFLNRIDEIVMFNPLGKDEIRKITDLQIGRLIETIEKSNNIKLSVTKEAAGWISAIGFDLAFGARPLKRTIQKYIINPLSERIIKGEFASGDQIEVMLDKRGLIEFVKVYEDVEVK
jgi:ATP-dependent Clp protease ATP-binding subunit ClpB